MSMDIPRRVVRAVVVGVVIALMILTACDGGGQATDGSAATDLATGENAIEVATIRDGRISDATWHWEIADFGPEMWVPFRDWVSESHPKDFDMMYVDGGGNFSPSAGSIERLAVGLSDG